MILLLILKGTLRFDLSFTFQLVPFTISTH